MSNAPIKPESPISKVDPEIAERMRVAAAAQGPETPLRASVPNAPVVLPASTVASMTPAQLEETVRNILAGAVKTGAVREPPPAEPDWSKVDERAATDLSRDMYIPVIEHDVPQYLDIRLADPEYIAVWVNRNPIRISEKKAEGYELVEERHLAKNYPVPLKFDSEGMYVYEDVVAMRVHKRIIFGKRRRAVEMSVNRLKNAKGVVKEKIQHKVIEREPRMEEAFDKGALSFF
jgi:hypothetical protein